MTPTGKFLADTPKWAKGLVVAAVVGGVVYVIYKATKGKGDSTSLPNVDGDIPALKKAGQLASYSQGQYDMYANKLKQAFYSYGTDEAAVYAVFQAMKNDLDVANLIKAFGIWKVEGSIFRPFDTRGDGDLSAWLTSEMDTAEINRVNTILASKGIKYTF